MIYVFYLFMLR